MSSSWVPIMLLFGTAIAAITDTRSGLIPNWLTLPIGMVAIIGHGIASGLAASAVALAAAIGCGFIPCLLFRKAAMGGGDVKLLAAIGALLGLSAGLEVQLTTYLLATSFALVSLAMRGQLAATLGAAVKLVRRPRRNPAPARETLHEVRLGIPAFLAALSWLLAGVVESYL